MVLSTCLWTVIPSSHPVYSLYKAIKLNDPELHVDYSVDVMYMYSVTCI